MQSEDSVTSDMEVLGGYSRDDLDSMAKAAVAGAKVAAISPEDAYDLAWSAIAERLVTDRTRTQRQSLVKTGRLAILEELDTSRRDGGYADGRTVGVNSVLSARFLEGWARGEVPPHDDDVVDLVTTRQTYRRLDEELKSVLLAMATHGRPTPAAASLGMTKSRLTYRVRRGRTRFMTDWFDGERPAAPRGRGRRAS